ncbi:MAG: glycosyltransferase, partial [Bacteroidales bacterium]|nr:glycosyltransferase [Bacteroidales bacterium]
MPPKVSVITITYNAGEFLEKTLLSVLNQTSSDLEYVLVDGASTDNTTDLIRQYEDLV